MSENVIYDWASTRNLGDWKFEGHGGLSIAGDGALNIRTANMGPLMRASNAWLYNVELPPDFEFTWTYRNGSLTNRRIDSEGVMILFCARPVVLKDLWEDPRPHARYSDICSYRKMVCYTCGFYRSPYGGAGQLRKLGGDTPTTWGESNWVADDGTGFDELSIMNKADEPLAPDDTDEYARFSLVKQGPRIRVSCNDRLVHDWSDEGQYRYWKEPLSGGRLALREFNGYIESYYSEIRLALL
ncbi:MAG: hypothetical protein JW909_03830 [Planctomycetes bacterium]|nr:hypothetical protein [Planctomycetota bacterium]